MIQIPVNAVRARAITIVPDMQTIRFATRKQGLVRNAKQTRIVETGACEKCETNADCASVPGKPVCLTTQGRCVECLTNPDCGDNPKGEICNENNYTCRPCEWDSDCEGQPNGDVCDKETGICVECLDNPDCVGNPNGEMCLTEFKICEQCEARSCTDTAQCGPNETCTDGQCVCPNGFWIRNCECVACPEGSTPVQGDDAVECVCPELYFWRNGQCVSCLTLFRSSGALANDYKKEMDQCTSTCSQEGQYVAYSGVPSGNFSGKCVKLASEFNIDSLSDAQLLEKYKRVKTEVGYAGTLPEETQQLFGENPTAADIRNKLHEILDGYYLSAHAMEWYSAQSWCRAKGANLAPRSDYFANNQALRFATGFATGYNFHRYWCDGISGGGWAGCSTTWQSGGTDNFDNFLWFACKK